MLLLRMLVSLAVLGAVGWYLVRLARRRGLGGLGTRALIDVESQRGLSRSSSIAVVRVGTRHLLLGVGDHGVQVLAEGDDLTELPPEPATDVASIASASAPAPASAAAPPPVVEVGAALVERLRAATARRART